MDIQEKNEIHFRSQNHKHNQDCSLN